MKQRYIQRLTSLISRRKQVYHTQTKNEEYTSLTELLQQIKQQKEEKNEEK